MRGFFKNFFRYLHPLNKIHIRISFEFHRPSSGNSGVAEGRLAAEKALAALSGLATGARMNVLGLDNLKRHYGANWEKVAEMVHLAVNMILKKHMKPGDRFAPVGGHGYVILFSGVDEAAAKERCRLISRDIHDTFLKNKHLAALDLKVATAVKAVNPVQLSRAREAKDLADLLEKDIPDPATVVELPSQARAMHEIPPEQDMAVAGADVLPPGISIGFRPLLDVGTRKVFGFFAVPCRDDTPGLEGYGVLSGSEAADPAALILQLDQLALARARKQRASLAARNRMTAFILSVHYRTLSDPARLASYQQFCAALSAEERASFVFEVTGFPKTLDVPAVRGLVKSVGSCGRAVMLHTRLDRPVSDYLSESGAQMLRLDITGENPLDAGLVPKMKLFMTEARSAKMKGFASGLSSIYLARAAAGAGFEALAGEAIWPLVRDVDPDIRVDTTSFLQAATGS